MGYNLNNVSVLCSINLNCMKYATEIDLWLIILIPINYMRFNFPLYLKKSENHLEQLPNTGIYAGGKLLFFNIKQVFFSTFLNIFFFLKIILVSTKTSNYFSNLNKSKITHRIHFKDFIHSVSICCLPLFVCARL